MYPIFESKENNKEQNCRAEHPTLFDMLVPKFLWIMICKSLLSQIFVCHNLHATHDVPS